MTARAPSPALTSQAYRVLRGALPPRTYARALILDRLKALKITPTPALLRQLEGQIIQEVEALLDEAERQDTIEDAALPVLATALVSRLASTVTRAALEGAGVTRWRWRTQRDGRVRPEHAALEGRIFTDPHPTEGLPGSQWGCRCWMEPA